LNLSGDRGVSTDSGDEDVHNYVATLALNEKYAGIIIPVMIDGRIDK